MAILDTLTVAIELNADMFTSGVKKATEGLEKVHETVGKSTDTLVDAGKKGADTFASFRREAMGAFALFSGGLGVPAFAGAMAQANTALASLSRQLDIAPQKLNQLHEAMKATGGSAGDVDSFFKTLQAKASTNEGLADLTRLSQLTGVQFLDQNGKVRGDALDQLAHSRTWHTLNRGVQEQYAGQLGLSSAGVNLVDRDDYDQLQKKFAGMGPTPEQIKQGEQLLADWTELKANTDQVMQQVFSDLEPSIHNFLQAMIALEKSNIGGIASELSQIAEILGILSALLTAKRFLSVLGLLRGASGSPVGIATTVGVVAANDAVRNGYGPGDTGAGQYYASQAGSGPTMADLENHYRQRTGSWTSIGMDKDTERKLWDRDNTNPDLDRLTGAVAMQESGGNPNAVNAKTGAAGMLQFMPATARENGVANPFDPDQAWAGGRRYLGRLMARYHDQRKALAAYNWGMGNLDKDMRDNGGNWQSYLPHETSDYLAKVGRNYETGNVVHHNSTTHSPTINVVVNGGHGTAAEIGKMARKGTSEALERHQNGRVT